MDRLWQAGPSLDLGRSHLTAASDGSRIAPKLRSMATPSREALGTRRRGGRGGRATAVTLDEITGGVVDAAYRLHKGLGPGLLESVYEKVLARDLQRRGFQVERQKPIAFEYEGMHFDDGLRVDLLVDDCVVVEIKSVERLLPVHPKQVLTYLRLLKLPVRLPTNFGAPTLRQGLRRRINGLDPSESPRLRVSA